MRKKVANWIVDKVCDTNNWVEGITCDDEGTIYFSTIKGVWQLNKSKSTPECIFDYTGLESLIHHEGKLYCCHRYFNRIFEYSKETKNATMIIGDGQYDQDMDANILLFETKLPGISGITIGSHWNILVCMASSIVTIDQKSNQVSHVVELRLPKALVSSPDGTIYVCDSTNQCIQQIGRNNKVTLLAGGNGQQHKDGTLKKSAFVSPSGIILRKNGSLIITDHSSIRKVDLHSKTISTLVVLNGQKALCLTQSPNGTIYIGTDLGVVRLRADVWKWERFLWIAKLKEDENYCPMAKLPVDIIKEIASVMHMLVVGTN